jgi:hypothetical protein
MEAGRTPGEESQAGESRLAALRRWRPDLGAVKAPLGDPPSFGQAASAYNESFDERPEVFVGAAFAGGIVLAGLVRWLGR